MVGDVAKASKTPPLARVWMRGRWWWQETCRNVEKNHLRLVFGCEGGGGGGRHGERVEKTTSGSRLDAREVVVVGDVVKATKTPPPARIWTRGRWWWQETCRKNKKNHLRLAFGRKGGGGGGSLGITGVSGGRRKNEWEKTGNDICRCPFSQRTSAWASHFLAPPPHISPPLNSLVG